MSFVNTKITSKHCDAMIFFLETQGIIYHFKGNYRSRMFLISFFIWQEYLEMYAYSLLIFLLPNSSDSRNLNKK